MNSKETLSAEIENVIKALKGTELPPTQVECIERALRAGSETDVQPLLALVHAQVVHEQRFAKALLDWVASSQSAAERMSAALGAAAQQMEDQLLAEFLSEDFVLS